MSGRLQGKVAIVTGGASGFGKGISERFSKEGAKVIVADLSEDTGSAVAKDVGGTFVKADVTNRSHWENLLKTAVDQYGQLDIVINNAGTTYSNKPTETVTDKDFDLVFNVNVRSIYISASVILPYFLEKGIKGSFIQISSTAGIRPRPGLTWYNASKAAVSVATKTMAVEYGPKGIRFNSVCPVFASGTGLYVLPCGTLDPADFQQITYVPGQVGYGRKPCWFCRYCSSRTWFNTKGHCQCMPLSRKRRGRVHYGY